MTLDAAPLLCLFIIASNIFTLKKDTTKMHCNNVRLSFPDNASMVVYQVVLIGH
jgi:hypothetical protein